MAEAVMEPTDRNLTIQKSNPMTEKEKAESLVDEFYQYTNTNSRENAKACARILAKEVIVKLKYNKVMKVVVDYWEDVLLEIEKVPAFKDEL